MNEAIFYRELFKLHPTLESGRISQARELLERLGSIAGSCQCADGKAKVILRFQRARIHLWEGDLLNADRLASAVLADFREIGDREWIALSHL